MMNDLIKKYPLINSLRMAFYRRFKKQRFTTSDKYWEDRYRRGGNSGAGSYNNLAEFKADIINDFISNKEIKSVIDFGCGDGNQLKYFNFENYLGFDVSKAAIQTCSTLFKEDNTKQFRLMNSYQSEAAELTISLDVIYHLVEEQTYSDYMNTLFLASDKFVMIYSSNTDKNNENAPHVKRRKFTKWIEQNQQKFQLLEHIPNKYSVNGDSEKSPFADFYIYQKK